MAYGASGRYYSMKNEGYIDSIIDLICCPNCGSDFSAKISEKTFKCPTCLTTYFSLGGIPCIFENGIEELENWRQQLGLLQQQGQKSIDGIRSISKLPYLVDETKSRMDEHAKSNTYSQKSIIDLFKSVGVSPALNANSDVRQVGRLAQYHELFLRDWCWGDQEIAQFENTENNLASGKIIEILNNGEAFDNVLFLGSGAGRLSWDIHEHLKPKATIALDMNPLLSLIADKMIKKRFSMKFSECKEHAPIDSQQTRYWPLSPIPKNTHLADTWFPLMADAWSVPLKKHSFDLIVTPWFIDINGEDVRDFLGLLDYLLKPGGLWINSGPLLYGPNTPIEQKYGANEIRSLVKTAGFTIESDQSYSTPYLYCPNSSRYRVEEIWLFSARKENNQLERGVKEKYSWILLPHLPIPAHIQCPASASREVHSVFAFIDGKLSVNDISLKIAPHLPPDIPARDYVIAALLTHASGSSR